MNISRLEYSIVEKLVSPLSMRTFNTVGGWAQLTEWLWLENSLVLGLDCSQIYSSCPTYLWVIKLWHWKWCLCEEEDCRSDRWGEVRSANTKAIKWEKEKPIDCKNNRWSITSLIWGWLKVEWSDLCKLCSKILKNVNHLFRLVSIISQNTFRETDLFFLTTQLISKCLWWKPHKHCTD